MLSYSDSSSICLIWLFDRPCNMRAPYVMIIDSERINLYHRKDLKSLSRIRIQMAFESCGDHCSLNIVQEKHHLHNSPKPWCHSPLSAEQSTLVTTLLGVPAFQGSVATTVHLCAVRPIMYSSRQNHPLAVIIFSCSLYDERLQNGAMIIICSTYLHVQVQ